MVYGGRDWRSSGQNYRTRRLTKGTYIMGKIKKSIIIGVAILVLLFCVYWVVWRVDIPVARGSRYLHEYEDYYYKTESILPLFSFNFGTGRAGRQIIYFKPGQKGKMLKQIKKDVNGYLEALIEEHGDIFYRYEINDDFKQARIYETPGSIDRRKRSELGPEVNSRIGSLIGLYHNIKEWRRPEGIYQAVAFIPPDD